MSTSLGSLERPDPTTALLESISPGLSNAVLQETAKTAESIDTVIFGFNPWCPIPNVTLSGFTFGVQHVVLHRMRLIELKTWKCPDIQPRTGGWAPGSVTSAGFFPSGSVGSKVTQRFQFPSESAKLLEAAFGKESANGIGFTILRSLTAVEDRDKLESVLLFRGIMETPLTPDSLSGAETCLELLPAFLSTAAPKLMARLLEGGIRVSKRSGVFQFSDGARAKAEGMIEDLRAAVAGATKAALDENTGVLVNTKRELIQSSKGQKDVKLTPDKRDEFLLTQFPSFSLDTDVERATRANASVTDAIRERGKEDALTLQYLLEMNKETLDQLKKANEINAQLAAQLATPKTPDASPPAS